MSRITPLNVVKVLAVLATSLFIGFYLVLTIGLTSRNRKVTIEGAIYTGISLAFFVFVGTGLVDILGFFFLGVTILSAIRAFMLRDLWLPAKGGQPQVAAPNWARTAPPPPPSPPHAYPQPSFQAQAPHAPAQPAPAPTVAPGPPAANDLSSALAWVSAEAKKNKYRIPSDAYVTLLETCQTLDAVTDAEARQPSADAGFEFELEAMVRKYLPSVLQSYLAVPAGMVDVRQPNGKTPNEELAEQLDLLSGQAEALHASRHRQMSAELSTNGNFLRERFGHRQSKAFDFGIE